MSRRFRSGTGGTYSGSTWEDWDGLSPNGRQYRNAITQETRNLSGAEYWAARKSDYPSQRHETWKDGKANIDAFKEEEPKRKGKEVPLEYKVFPQQRTFDRWEALEKEVEDAFLNGGIGFDQYQEKMAHILQKKDRAWYLLCKAKGWTEELEEYEIKKDIEKLGKQIEKQKEKNAREAMRMQERASRAQRRQPRGKAQSTGFTWIVVSVLAFIFVF